MFPVPLWHAYYWGGTAGNIVSVLYLGVKVAYIGRLLRRFFRATAIYTSSDLEHGRYATTQEIEEQALKSSSSSLDCPICFDAMQHPVILPCKHMFCESCISEWLERERSCPCCRNKLEDGGEVNVLTISRDGRTHLVPRIL